MDSVASWLLVATLLNSVNIHNFCDLAHSHDGGAYLFSDAIFSGSVEDCGCKGANICVRKCCDVGYVLANKTCVFNDTAEFKIDVYDGENAVNNDSVDFRFVPGMMRCAEESGYYRLEPGDFQDDAFFLQTDGSLWQPALKVYLEPDQFCLEVFDDIGVSALRCFPKGFKIAKRLNAIGMIVSMPFLLATFFVYAFLPDRNLHGKSLMCYVITLFGAYLLLVVIQTHTSDTSEFGCRTLALFCLFFFMVSFFWMNVMSIDIWWTFSGMRGFSGSKLATERRRFLLYSCYAWGVPAILVVLVAALNASLEANAWYNPGIGSEQCWFSTGIPTLLYFYGPLAIVIVANITLFARTALKIRRVQQDTALLRAQGNRKHSHENDKQRFNLYLKLLLAMGVNWSMEIVSWLVDWQVGHVPPPVWYLTDLCNALYGVFIFFIFVFKTSIWNLLKRRYYIVTGNAHVVRAMTKCSAAPVTDETSLSMTEMQNRGSSKP